MPSLPTNQWKLLRRRMHVLLYFLSPEEGLRGPEELDRLLARAGLGAAVAVLRDPELMRRHGLSRTGDLLAPWWQSLPPGATRRYARVPAAILETAQADTAVRDEIVGFVMAQELLSRKLLGLLRDSPEETTRVLSERYREAQEKAKREVPRLLRDMAGIMLEAARYLDDPELIQKAEDLKRLTEDLRKTPPEESGPAE